MTAHERARSRGSERERSEEFLFSGSGEKERYRLKQEDPALRRRNKAGKQVKCAKKGRKKQTPGGVGGEGSGEG
jgi:hypothetical protein